MVLYKFVERKWGEEFFKSGSLRLGTIYDFRDIVETEISRGDPAEGCQEVHRHVDRPMTFAQAKHEPIIQDYLSLDDESNNNTNIFYNTIFQQSRSCKDHFIFCTSHTYNEKLFREWYKKSNADYCYVINNPEAFYTSISNHISNSANHLGYRDIVYTEDPIDYESPHVNLHPGVTKSREKYEWQCENRSLWSVRGPCPPIKPWNIYVPEAIQYCEPFSNLNQIHIKYLD